MTSPIAVATPRLRLRDLETHDYEALRLIDADPEVQWWRGAPSIAPGDTRRFLAELVGERARSPRSRYLLGVTVPPDDRVVGTCWLLLHWPDWLGPELGYQFRRDQWGRGYATEVVRALLRFGFRDLGCRRIWARVNPPNVASWRVLEKAGLRREGHLLRCEYAAGEWRDLYLYAILADEG